MTIEKLNTRLNQMNARILGVTLGSGKNITVEQVAKEINRALDQLEAGNFEEVNVQD